MATETTTPSIQDILSDYQTSIGAGGVNTNMLLQALRNRQTMAEQEDAATAKNWESLGKAGLNTVKLRRDFLLAKRANPDLKIGDFLADPRTGAKYMKNASDMIASGKAEKIGLAETFGLKGIKTPSFKSKTDDSIPRGTPVEKGYVKKEIQRGTPVDPLEKSRVAAGTVPKGKPYNIPSESFDFSGVSENVINKYKNELAGGGKNWQRNLQEALDAGIEKRVGQIPTENISETANTANTGGSAMKALGLAGSLYGLGTGLRDIKRGRGDLSTVARTAAGGLGTLSSLGVIGAVNPLVGLGLGGLSMLGRRR